ncbi:MAG: GlsB/YeaQ/YmgE family stress response membrane protein [Armatimonadota bacterium]
MSIIGWIILGGLAGWLASVIMGTRDQGCITDVIVGIIGALLGGFIFNALMNKPLTGFSLWSFFVAVIGAAILLAILKAVRGRKRM